MSHTVEGRSSIHTDQGFARELESSFDIEESRRTDNCAKNVFKGLSKIGLGTSMIGYGSTAVTYIVGGIGSFAHLVAPSASFILPTLPKVISVVANVFGAHIAATSAATLGLTIGVGVALAVPLVILVGYLAYKGFENSQNLDDEEIANLTANGLSSESESEISPPSSPGGLMGAIQEKLKSPTEKVSEFLANQETVESAMSEGLQQKIQCSAIYQHDTSVQIESKESEQNDIIDTNKAQLSSKDKEQVFFALKNNFTYHQYTQFVTEQEAVQAVLSSKNYNACVGLELEKQSLKADDELIDNFLKSEPLVVQQRMTQFQEKLNDLNALAVTKGFVNSDGVITDKRLSFKSNKTLEDYVRDKTLPQKLFYCMPDEEFRTEYAKVFNLYWGKNCNAEDPCKEMGQKIMDIMNEQSSHPLCWKALQEMDPKIQIEEVQQSDDEKNTTRNAALIQRIDISDPRSQKVYLLTLNDQTKILLTEKIRINSDTGQCSFGFESGKSTS